MINKRLINTGVAAAAFDPLQNFETVTYTGNGGTQKITGYIRKGAAFNGSSSKITSSVPKSSDQSFSFWTNHGSQSNSTATYFGYSNSASNGFFAVQVSSGNISILYWNGSTYARNTSTTSLTDGDWHHVVVTTSGNVFNIYVDGNTTPAYTTTLSGFTHTSRSDLQISYETPDGSSSYFNGKIDQFRVFNKVISSSEITTLYGETYASSTKSTTDIFGDGSGVALYELDEDANDTAGAGTNGYIGDAAFFNGSSSKIELQTLTTGLSGSAPRSVSLWVNLSSLPSAGVYTFYSSGANTNGQSFQVQLTTTGILSVSYYNRNINSTTALSTNTWYHIVATYKGGDVSSLSNTEIYINGNSETLVNGGGTYTGSANIPDTNHSIGYSKLDNLYFTNGKIDDVRIYSDVLTSTEVGYIYNNTTASIPTDNLVAYYKLDGDATDEQGSYDGTATNVSWGYDGTATNVNFLGMAFQPDLVWLKRRDTTANHRIIDSVRGADMEIFPNLTNAEVDFTTLNWSFDTNGFSFNTNDASYNASGGTYVAWCWKAADTTTTISAGTVGNTIASDVRANQAAGFSIVKYTTNYNGSNNVRVGHGLSQTPQIIIQKPISTTGDWLVTNNIISGTTDWEYLVLNSNAAQTTSFTFFDGANAPNSTTFRDGNANGTEIISYCFHSVDGYQKVGSYSGTGSSGLQVTTGFKPRFVLGKCINPTGGNGDWWMVDSQRISDTTLYPFYANLSNAEQAVDVINFDSNGFTVQNTSENFNNSSKTYIYLAIA